jgi:hypothetical protein
MVTDAYRGMTARITRGHGAGQERIVDSNTAGTLTVTRAWTLAPDSTSFFVVAESSWHFAAKAWASPVEFEIPNRAGATVHISGRSANVHDRESAYELSPLTRWRIGGAGTVDGDVPGRPLFGLTPTGRGGVELAGVGFQDLANTSTITSATLTLHYWDELSSPSTVLLSGAITADATSMALSATVQKGSLLQIEEEIVLVEDVLDGTYSISRGAHGTTANSHADATPAYLLEQKVFIVPFARGFFGSPASGSFSYPILLADARIASAELFVTNSWGNSDTTIMPYTATVNSGLRTLSGGQFSIQVEGYLAIQTDAAPAVVVEDTHAVRDVFAVVGEAPTGAPIVLQLKVNGSPYCQLTIPTGATISNVVNCFGFAPLLANARIGLDVLSVGQTADTSPGRDLTVTIRL